MKILLVNYRYFIRGGTDRYFFNIKHALEKAGHAVVPFAFDYDETIPNEYQKYFPEPITSRGPCMLDDQDLTFSKKLKGSIRMFYNSEVNRKFRLILEKESLEFLHTS